MTNDGNISELLEPLKIALRLEREGKQFFSEAAGRVTGRTARRTFEFLAAEEDKHIKRIEEFYESLEESSGTRVLDTEESDAEARLVAFNDRMAQLKDELQPTLSDVEAYRTALRFENGAEEFYEQQVAAAVNPRIKKFYQWLINEEAMHGRLLNSCIQFAEDPAAWFSRRKA